MPSKIPYHSTSGMGHIEWLKARRNGIGGSDVAAILGLSPWRSPYTVWTDKMGYLPIDENGSEFTEWGTIMEPIIAHKFAEETGKYVYRQNKMFYRPEHPFLTANIDRDIAGEPGFLEIKTATEYKATEWADGNIPVYYQTQIQHYMYVLNRPYAYFAYLVGGHHFGITKINRDQKVIDEIEDELISWWNQYMIGKTPPPTDGTDSTTAALRALYPQDNGEFIDLGSKFDVQLRNRHQAKQTIDALNSDVKTVDNEIRQALGDASGGETQHFNITYHANKRGTRTLRIKEKQS